VTVRQGATAIRTGILCRNDREVDHGEEGEVEDQKAEGQEGRAGAQETARRGEEERGAQVGRQEVEAEGPQGRGAEAGTGSRSGSRSGTTEHPVMVHVRQRFERRRFRRRRIGLRTS
jgi:hypothetical protein